MRESIRKIFNVKNTLLKIIYIYISRGALRRIWWGNYSRIENMRKNIKENIRKMLKVKNILLKIEIFI